MEQKAPHIIRMKNGMSSLPSDVSSPDDALSAEVGMVFENGEHRVIQDPVAMTGAVDFNVLFIHDFANYTHLIGTAGGMHQGSHNLVWGDATGIEENPSSDAISGSIITGGAWDVKSITAVGNTLIVSTTDGLRYFLWKDGEYKDLGSTLPEIDVELSLEDPELSKQDIKGYANVTGMVYPSTIQYLQDQTRYLKIGDNENFKNAIIGHISDVQNQFKEKGYFLYPFWVRLGYQLYDEQNVGLTNPILMLACVRNNNYIVGIGYEDTSSIESNTCAPTTFAYFPHVSRLKVKINNDLDDWKDIINGIDIYTSEQVCPFYIEEDYTIKYENYPGGVIEKTDSWDGIRARSGNLVYESMKSVDTYSNHIINEYHTERERILEIRPNIASASHFTAGITEWDGYVVTLMPKMKEDIQIIKELVDNSQFYRLLEIDYENITNSWFYVDEKISKNDLLNLTSQHQLAHDDYFNHCKLNADTILSYNGRLHLGGVERGFYEGYNHFLVSSPQRADTAKYDKIIVSINTDEGEKRVCREFDPLFGELTGYYYFYPDPRAKEVTFCRDDVEWKFTLKQHPWLHGAYFFGALPSSNDDHMPEQQTDEHVYDNSATEYLPNQLLVSEVSNPFLFTVDGAEEIGSGRILGLVSNTEAVSEGQFGQYPLYAFTSEGIWALSVKTDGTYDTIRPLSREVCNNSKSIVQTDKAVYFTSDKGLMRIMGSQVACVSQQMMGKRLNTSAMERHDDGEISLSVVDGVLIYNTGSATSIDGIIENSDDIATVVGETLIFGGDGDVILLNSIPPFEQFIRPTGNISPRICYDYRNSRLWLFREDSDWVYVHSMREQTFALYSLPSKLRSAHILYPDTWLQSDDGTMLSMGKIPFIDNDENIYSAMLLTRPVAFGSPFAYKQVQQLEHLSTKDSSDITLRLFGSNNTREWHEERVVRGRPYRYFRFLIKLHGLSATDAYSSMMVMTEQRRQGRLHPEDWHTAEVENARPLTDET